MVFTRFNVEAMAEWAWNAKGRSAREFAISWATREGYADPELFADWCEANGPVAWDVYGSCWPEYQKRRNPKPVTVALKSRMLHTLAEANKNTFRGPWGDFRSPEQFSSDAKQAAKALELARKMGKPEYVLESTIVQGYVDSVSALWELNKIVTPNGIAAADRAKAKGYFEAYLAGLRQAADALPKWVTLVSPGTPANDIVEDPLKVIAKLRETMAKTAAEMGIALGKPE
jgi:hypothetical protein